MSVRSEVEKKARYSDRVPRDIESRITSSHRAKLNERLFEISTSVTRSKRTFETR